MTMPLMKPRRKNPVLRTRQMNLPPFARGRTALGMTAAAAEGRFELQVCQRCQAVQYPPRDACHRCLSSQLDWTAQGGEGVLRFTESQSVAVQKLVRLAPQLGMSDETYAKVMTANLRVLKKLGRA